MLWFGILELLSRALAIYPWHAFSYYVLLFYMLPLRFFNCMQSESKLNEYPEPIE